MAQRLMRSPAAVEDKVTERCAHFLEDQQSKRYVAQFPEGGYLSDSIRSRRQGQFGLYDPLPDDPVQSYRGALSRSNADSGECCLNRQFQQRGLRAS